jgi:PKD repeat protein
MINLHTEPACLLPKSGYYLYLTGMLRPIMVKWTRSTISRACLPRRKLSERRTHKTSVAAMGAIAFTFMMILSGLWGGGLVLSHPSPVHAQLPSTPASLPEKDASGMGAGAILGPLGGNLTSVVVGPPAANISVGSKMIFVASPVCTGLICPSGTTYQWNQTRPSLGTLSSSSGDPVTFTAGTTTGTLALFVNATLNGTTKQSSPVDIIINNGIRPLYAYLYFESSNSGYAPLTVTMAGNGTGGVPPYSYSWKLGDGSKATGITVTHTYTTAGIYTATLTVNDSRGSSASDDETIVVLNSNSTTGTLQASIVFDSANVGPLPLSVTMTGEASGGTSPYSYTWAFGDSSTGVGDDLTHTYTKVPSGCAQAKCDYLVNLTVDDSAGNSVGATAQVVIDVNSTPSFKASMTDSPASGVAPLWVSFSANASGGTSPYSFAWAFGDGSTGSDASCQHTYTDPGTYTVQLTAVDANGSIAQVTSTILAYPAPTGNQTGALELSITVDPATGPAPLTTYFNASASGGTPPYTFNWTFGDGSPTVSGDSVFHTHTTQGGYVATVVLRDASGDEAASGVFVTVTGALDLPAPLSVFVTALNLHGNAPLTVTFTPAVRGGSAPYQLIWGFGDGAFVVRNGTGPVTHTYSTPGTYESTLQVTDASGNTSDWSVGIYGAQNTGGKTQAFPLDQLVTMVVVVVIVAVLAVLVASKRRKETPPHPSKSNGSGTDYRTSGDSGRELFGTGEEPPSPTPVPDNDPLHDALAGLCDQPGPRVARILPNAITC